MTVDTQCGVTKLRIIVRYLPTMTRCNRNTRRPWLDFQWPYTAVVPEWQLERLR